MSRADIDPIILELIRCKLESGAQRMAVALWKSSYSTVIREVLDYSTALFDARGNIIAQSAQLPFQMMTMSFPLQNLHEKQYDWRKGDIVLLNDPYVCNGQHLPDVMVFRPIFWDQELMGFSGAIAHMIDMGGGAPGSYLATATEIYQEGLRIPPIKIVKEGEINQEVLDMIALNVREPEKVIGDLTAMISCTRIGEDCLAELGERYDRREIKSAMDEILDGSERAFRKCLGEIPDGTYIAKDYVDDDGQSDQPITIQVAIHAKNGELKVDFTGSSPQVRGPVNSTLAMTLAAVNYTFIAALAKGVAKNDGCHRVIEITAPSGSVVNARSPAPVASRVTVCHRIVDVVLQALGQVLPHRTMAGYYGVSNICNLGGNNSETGQPWVHFEIEVGGWGGRYTSDGPDAFSAHLHNLSNTPIEVVESSLPLRIERYELLSGSGGRGQFRGGLGLRRDIRILEDGVVLNTLGDRCKFPPKGLAGGDDGRPGRYRLNPGEDNEELLPNKVANRNLVCGDVISIETPGGGGFGPPELRDPEKINKDRLEGKVMDNKSYRQ